MVDGESFEVLDSKILIPSGKEQISVLKYSPIGSILLCGTSRGKIW
jgi:hypothetical protein